MDIIEALQSLEKLMKAYKDPYLLGIGLVCKAAVEHIEELHDAVEKVIDLHGAGKLAGSGDSFAVNNLQQALRSNRIVKVTKDSNGSVISY